LADFFLPRVMARRGAANVVLMRWPYPVWCGCSACETRLVDVCRSITAAQRSAIATPLLT
jgi:hypothetical protein